MEEFERGGGECRLRGVVQPSQLLSVGASCFEWAEMSFVNPFFPTVPTCAVRETASLGPHMLELSCENATV